MNNTKDTIQGLNAAYLQTALGNVISEQLAWNQVKMASVGKVVEKVLASGNAQDAVEVLKVLGDLQSIETQAKAWESIIRRIEKIENRLDAQNDRNERIK